MASCRLVSAGFLNLIMSLAFCGVFYKVQKHQAMKGGISEE